MIEDDSTRRGIDPALAVALGSNIGAVHDEPAGAAGCGSRPDAASMAIAARPTRAATYTATTVVEVASIGSGTRAGLAAFGNRDNVLAATVERARSGNALRRRIDTHRLADTKGRAPDACDT